MAESKISYASLKLKLRRLADRLRADADDYALGKDKKALRELAGRIEEILAQHMRNDRSADYATAAAQIRPVRADFAIREQYPNDHRFAKLHALQEQFDDAVNTFNRVANGELKVESHTVPPDPS